MIGVVDPEALLGRSVAALDGVAVEERAADAVAADPATAVAVGEAALIDLVRADVDVPILPIDAGDGVGSVPLADGADAVERTLTGEYETRRRPVLGVALDGERAGRAVFDAMLVREEPARVSEYGVAAPDPIERFRADGVVVATPAGSHGYARAAGGPVVIPDGDAVAVVPVGAFAIRIDHWVVDAGTPVTLTVERDEGDVGLLLDGRDVGRVPPGVPVEVRIDGAFETVALADERAG